MIPTLTHRFSQVTNPIERRCVVVREDGIYQIFAVASTQPPSLIEGAEESINLVAAKRSYYLYKPVMAPCLGPLRTSGGSFNSAQR